MRSWCLLALGLWATSAAAHDLPVRNNRAAIEAMTIERGARAPLSDDKARARLFSLVASKLSWPDSSLNVCFWNGDQALRDRVAAIANELTANLRIKLAWGGTCPGPAAIGGAWMGIPIRVSLTGEKKVMGEGDDARAYFALIGRQASFDHPTTVNLPFPASPSDDLLRNKVLHEFCHVLGCLHEHQRLGCADLFDKPKIMAAFQLSEAEYDKNFDLLPQGGLYGPSAVTPLDAASIMLYSFKPDMFRVGTHPLCLQDPPVTKPSGFDFQGLKLLYSAPVGPSIKLTDFPVFAIKSQQIARKQRELLIGYRALLADVGATSPMSGSLTAVIESLRNQADAAEADAASFAPAPEDLKAARAALALLPKD